MKQHYDILDHIEENLDNKLIHFKIILISFLSMASSCASFGNGSIKIDTDNSNSKLMNLYNSLMLETDELKKDIINDDNRHHIEENLEIINTIIEIHKEETEIFFSKWTIGTNIFNFILFLFLVFIFSLVFSHTIIVLLFVMGVCIFNIVTFFIYRNYVINLFEIFEG